MPLLTNYIFKVLDYTERSLADGRMVTLLNTLRNFNANTCLIEVTLWTFIHHELFIVFHVYKFMNNHIQIDLHMSVYMHKW